jgi:hypothetical protein
MLEKYFSPFIDRAEKIKDNSWFYEDDIKVAITYLNNEKKELNNEIPGNNMMTYDIRSHLINEMNKPIELLYCFDKDENLKIYIKQ